MHQVSVYESGGVTDTKTRTLHVCTSDIVCLYGSSVSSNLIAYRWAVCGPVVEGGSVMNMGMGFPTIIQYNSNNHLKRF